MQGHHPLNRLFNHKPSYNSEISPETLLGIKEQPVTNPKPQKEHVEMNKTETLCLILGFLIGGIMAAIATVMFMDAPRWTYYLPSGAESMAKATMGACDSSKLCKTPSKAVIKPEFSYTEMKITYPGSPTLGAEPMPGTFPNANGVPSPNKQAQDNSTAPTVDVYDMKDGLVSLVSSFTQKTRS